jgi:hypothetical protein
MNKIVIYFVIKRLYSIFGYYNSFTPHVLVDLIRFHQVSKALLVVCSLVNVWSLCQLIHQVLNAQYGHLKVQCILAQMCIYYLKLSKLTAYPPQNYLHRTISQINEVSKLLVVIHWLLPLLRFSMSLIYHMI